MRYFFAYHELEEKEKKSKLKSKQLLSNKSIENKVGSKILIQKIEESEETLCKITEKM